MVHTKCSCVNCRVTIMPRHLVNHKCKETYTATETTCPFCGTTAKSLNAAAQHQIRCNLNPGKVKPKGPSNFIEYHRKIRSGELQKQFTNRFDKAIKLGLPKPEVTSETRKKISEATKKQSWSADRRSKHSEAMKEAVKNNPESYTSSNRGRTKQIEFDGIKFQGKWELTFYQWAKACGLNPKRATEGFPYVWNGSRTYFPDFYIESMNLYIEVKGYKTERDDAKWKQFPLKLLIVDKVAIDKIVKNCYNINN